MVFQDAKFYGGCGDISSKNSNNECVEILGICLLVAVGHAGRKWVVIISL